MRFYLITKNVKHMIVMAMLHSSSKVAEALVSVEDLKGLEVSLIYSKIFLVTWEEAELLALPIWAKV